MKKSNFLFIQYVLLIGTILLGYTHCRCTPTPSPQDTSQSSSPADSDNNTPPPATITQEMIDIVTDSVTNTDPKFKFLLDRLQELKNGDKTNIDQQNVGFYSFTALHHAANLGNPSIVAALLKLGANPTIKDSNGGTPFIVSFVFNYGKILETGETFLNDPNIASFIDLKEGNNKSPLVLIEEQLQNLDPADPANKPKIDELSLLKQKMINQGAKP